MKLRWRSLSRLWYSFLVFAYVFSFGYFCSLLIDSSTSVLLFSAMHIILWGGLLFNFGVHGYKSVVRRLHRIIGVWEIEGAYSLFFY
jgi:hypothetical protein